VIRSASGFGPAGTCDLDWSFVMTLECPVCGSAGRCVGRQVRCVNAALQHPEQPWMLADLDCEVLCSLHE
jgi:predicted phage-related endonuclease